MIPTSHGFLGKERIDWGHMPAKSERAKAWRDGIPCEVLISVPEAKNHLVCGGTVYKMVQIIEGNYHPHYQTIRSSPGSYWWYLTHEVTESPCEELPHSNIPSLVV